MEMETTVGLRRASWLACNVRAHRPMWRVRVRKGNYLTFNGRKFTPSAYSEVVCPTCRCSWRTKGAFVDAVPDLD